MRVSKFLSIIGCVTLCSLLYVYQQTEIFRLAYAGQKKVALLEVLLDKNSILRYNIEKNTSLVSIGGKVSQVADFEMPESYRLVRLVVSGETPRLTQKRSRKENMLVRIFGIKRQAEAKTTKP